MKCGKNIGCDVNIRNKFMRNGHRSIIIPLLVQSERRQKFKDNLGKSMEMVEFYANLSSRPMFSLFLLSLRDVKLWCIFTFSSTYKVALLQLHAARNRNTDGWKLCKDSITIEMDLQELYHV